MSLTSFVLSSNVILVSVSHLMFYYIYVIPHSKNSVKHNRLKTSCVLLVAYFLGTVAHYLCILVDELPLWLTLNFPNLCIYPWIRTYTWVLAPAGMPYVSRVIACWRHFLSYSRQRMAQTIGQSIKSLMFSAA